MSVRKRLYLLLNVPIVLASLASSLAAQSVSFSVGSASGTAGATVSVPVSFSTSGDAQPTAFQWTLNFPSSVTPIDATPGTALGVAGKSIDCRNASGSMTCLVFGLNTTVVSSGMLASVTLQIAASATTSIPLSLSGVSASTAAGQPIPVTASGGTITLSAPLGGSSLSCTPATVAGPGTASCSVTISETAPAGGTTVSLSSNNVKVTVPSSVLVLAGQIKADFSATVAAVSTNETAIITAETDSLSLMFMLQLASGLQIDAVANGASFQAGISPDSWITIKGTNLSSKTDTWNHLIVNGTLPTTLDEVSVTVGDQAAYVEYISAGQINALTPRVPAGTAQVTVKNSNGSSQTVIAQVEALQPAFFQWGTYAVATRQDFSLAVKNGTFPGTPTVPAKPGDVIILWGTGFGPTSPSAPVGVETPSDTTYYTANPVSVTVGNKPATVYGAALAPGYAGLYQVAIQIPASLANGDYPVVATIFGRQSPSTTLITVQE
jgi:uncharacterized protein (TIGR03437 family)